MTGNIQVLIIDDDRVFCQLLEKGLTRLGYQIATAKDAAEALMPLVPGVILLDMRLGEESGLALIEPLTEKYPGAKIIVVTGYASLATAVTAVKKGAQNYIAKPVDVKGVDQAIRDCLLEDDVFGKEPLAEIPRQAPRLKSLEWEHINRVLAENQGNISRTAQQLGMHRRTLQRKLKKHAPTGNQ